jgi:hypothetical protein
MNVEIGIEIPHFLFREHINGISIAAWMDATNFPKVVGHDRVLWHAAKIRRW